MGAKVVVTPTAWPSTDLKSVAKEKIKTLVLEGIHPSRPAETISYYERYVDTFLPTTISERDLIHKRYGIALEKCKVIPNGVIPPKKINLEDNQFYKNHDLKDFILFSGSLRSNKNVDLLIKTCLKNKWPLVVMGEASVGSDDYANLCRSLKMDDDETPILFTGFVEHGSQLYNEIFSLASCVCIPSDFETFCLAAAEGSALAKPVVIPGDGGTSSVFDNVGTYLNEYTIDALTQAIEKSLNSDQNSLNLLSQKILSQFSWDHIIDDLLSTYKSVL